MTKIEWTDMTVNPIVGCSKISPACDNCYAERMARRLKGMGLPQYQDVVDANGWTGKIGYDWSQLDKLKHHVIDKKVFMVSMGDLFHESISFTDLRRLFDELYLNDGYIFQILTKRPERMLEFCRAIPHPMFFDKRLWLGVTAENQYMADYRIQYLLRVPAKVHFVSIEPMLGPVDLIGAGGILNGIYKGLDWVIAGPETGPHKHKCEAAWLQELQAQCAEFNVPFFLKKNADGTPSNIHNFPGAHNER